MERLSPLCFFVSLFRHSGHRESLGVCDSFLYVLLFCSDKLTWLLLENDTGAQLNKGFNQELQLCH